jgi:membrane protein
VREIIEDGLGDMSAQLAYNAVLSLFPFLIFLVTIIAYLPVRGLADQMLDTVRPLMPEATMPFVEHTVNGVVREQKRGLLLLSLGVSIWAASGGVVALTKGLNSAYDVVETRSWLRVRARSILIMLAATVLLIVAMTALMIGPHLIERVSALLGLGRIVAVAWRLLRWPATLLAMSTLLGMFYWACPNLKQPFRLLTPGSLAAVPAWVAVSLGFNAYVGHLGTFNKTYGTLGAGMVLLTWIYLTGFIVLIGGEINALVAQWREQGP